MFCFPCKFYSFCLCFFPTNHMILCPSELYDLASKKIWNKTKTKQQQPSIHSANSGTRTFSKKRTELFTENTALKDWISSSRITSKSVHCFAHTVSVINYMLFSAVFMWRRLHDSIQGVSHWRSAWMFEIVSVSASVYRRLDKNHSNCSRKCN